MHKGIDIRCNDDAVLATENNGKVVVVNQNKNTLGGKSLTVEYTRTDGSKVQCTYMHLKAVSYTHLSTGGAPSQQQFKGTIKVTPHALSLIHI